MEFPGLAEYHPRETGDYEGALSSAAGTREGRTFRILNILDEHTRECLCIMVARRITAQDVIDQRGKLFLERWMTEHLRSDNEPESADRAIRHEVHF